MALSSKSLREIESVAEDSYFDFGEPEVLSVEISKDTYLSLHEPSAEDLIEITKISNDKSLGEIEATLRTICILHSPEPGGKKLTIKDAKRLRAKQIRLLGEAINSLLGMEEDEDDMKSEGDS
jgi:hypothetical protein